MGKERASETTIDRSSAARRGAARRDAFSVCRRLSRRRYTHPRRAAPTTVNIRARSRSSSRHHRRRPRDGRATRHRTRSLTLTGDVGALKSRLRLVTGQLAVSLVSRRGRSRAGENLKDSPGGTPRSNRRLTTSVVDGAARRYRADAPRFARCDRRSVRGTRRRAAIVVISRRNAGSAARIIKATVGDRLDKKEERGARLCGDMHREVLTKCSRRNVEALISGPRSSSLRLISLSPSLLSLLLSILARVRSIDRTGRGDRCTYVQLAQLRCVIAPARS